MIVIDIGPLEHGLELVCFMSACAVAGVLPALRELYPSHDALVN